MSWFSKNYEKTALGGAAVVALGLGVLGFSKYRSVAETFASSLQGGGNNNTAVLDANLDKAKKSMGHVRAWEQGKAGKRPVDLFTGIPLFIHREGLDKAIDLLTAPAVHSPIPNTWWLDNRLDPGFADSPSRDPDGDGFSNLDEFLAGTDPNDSKSHPALIYKLMYVKDESLTWVLRPGNIGADGKSFPFKYEDSLRQPNKVAAGAEIAPGGLFFAKEPMKERFKLLGHEVKQEPSPNTHVMMDVTRVTVEDQRPNKKGKVYTLPAPLQEERKNQFAQYDRTAVLSLEAIGLNGKEFKVEENTSFILPPPDTEKSDTEKKPTPIKCFLKEVTPASITVEYEESPGKTKTLTINKGSVPQTNK